MVALIILYKNRKHLEQGYIKDYMLILYQGLKPKVFYWEFVNTLRKGLILWCSVFLSTESPMYQTLFSVIILVLIMRLQLLIRPYKYNINNDLELSAINSRITTLFCGTIFSQTQANYKTFNSIALTFLIIVNSVFIIKWVFFFLLSLNIKNENFKVFLKNYAFIILKKECLKTDKMDDLVKDIKILYILFQKK